MFSGISVKGETFNQITPVISPTNDGKQFLTIYIEKKISKWKIAKATSYQHGMYVPSYLRLLYTVSNEIRARYNM